MCIMSLKEICYENLNYEPRLYKSKPKTYTFPWTFF